MKSNHEFMKSAYDKIKTTDQREGKEQPEILKPFSEEQKRIPLPKVDLEKLESIDLLSAIFKRRSHRKFLEKSLTKLELATLLFGTQGIREIIKRKDKSYATYRMIPSAGARHPFETYLAINNVDEIPQGVYRYLPETHEIMEIRLDSDLENKLISANLGQIFAGKSAVTFIWAVIPYRAEWRYANSSHKGILLDAGHICQNLYLICEAFGCGTCAIAAYDQKKIDELIEVDGEDEFVVYVAPVGKIEEDQHEEI